MCACRRAHTYARAHTHTPVFICHCKSFHGSLPQNTLPIFNFLMATEALNCGKKARQIRWRKHKKVTQIKRSGLTVIRRKKEKQILTERAQFFTKLQGRAGKLICCRALCFTVWLKNVLWQLLSGFCGREACNSRFKSLATELLWFDFI